MDALRSLPRVDAVAAHAALDDARRRLGAPRVMDLARRAVDDARARVKAGAPCPTLDELATDAARAASSGPLAARARRVINATGVILHTNLGRAPLGADALATLAASAGGYTSIEIDLETGRRGARGAFAEAALAALTGADAALVVNNNAAATLLALTAIVAAAPPGARRVIVSRGELVEIGGGFRVPDVCARSGAELVEVGTTNKTRVGDYARALDAGGAAAILRVHPGNFRQTGFVERPRLAELAALARARGVPLVKDLGGGALVDLAPLGLNGEPLARDSVEAGCDLVCFSCDKVLGGPQGGAIVGRAALVERARKDPLARAVRLGRLPLVALEATLAAMLEGRVDDVPALRMMRTSLDALRARADAWATALAGHGVEARVASVAGAVGGGALAEAELPSFGVALDAPDVDAVAARLRAGDPPVVGRIHGGSLLLDARTVQPDEDAELVAAVVAAHRG